MTDAIKKQVEGAPLSPAAARAEAKAQVESTAARRHREMMQALSGEIPNATYASKRELVEKIDAIANHINNNQLDIYQKLNNISMHQQGVAQTLGDLYAEESSFHRDWRETQARLEKTNTRLSSWHLITNILRLIVNTGILVMLVLYLLDMG